MDSKNTIINFIIIVMLILRIYLFINYYYLLVNWFIIFQISINQKIINKLIFDYSINFHNSTHSIHFIFNLPSFIIINAFVINFFKCVIFKQYVKEFQ